MTQEEKDLVLRDLCARLPFQVICKITYIDVYVDGSIKKTRRDTYLTCDYLDDYIKGDAECKPYLRPLSSMTEEEKRELQSFFPGSFGGQWLNLDEGFIDIYECESTTRLYLYDATGLTEWLNKKMFDFRGLIPEGLALSTDVFNPYKH